MELIKRLSEWRRHLTTPRIRKVQYFERFTDVPSYLPQQLMAIVGTVDAPKWAVFRCPCRRDHRITLNLQPTNRPRWRLQLHPSGPTLRPSVFVRDKTRCHFWIRRGRVIWARFHVSESALRRQ